MGAKPQGDEFGAQFCFCNASIQINDNQRHADDATTFTVAELDRLMPNSGGAFVSADFRFCFGCSMNGVIFVFPCPTSKGDDEADDENARAAGSDIVSFVSF